MIPGITTRNRMPRLGKIRLGEKREGKGGREYPAALDYFNFRDVPELAQLYGEQCREIFPVMFPADEEDVWFPTFRAAYGTSGLYCRSTDGETATRVFVATDKGSAAFVKEQGLDVSEGEMFDLPCPGEDCPYFQNKRCRNLGRLFLLLPDVPRFGVYEITTTSANSMLNVLSVARAVHKMIGRLAGVPFALKLEPMEVQPEGKAKTVHVLNLECRASLRQLASIRNRLISGGGGALALIDAPDDTPDDLFPHGGQALDRELSGRSLPAPRTITDLTRTLKSAEPAPEPSPVEPPVPSPTPQAPRNAGRSAPPADRPAPSPAPDSDPVLDF